MTLATMRGSSPVIVPTVPGNLAMAANPPSAVSTVAEIIRVLGDPRDHFEIKSIQPPLFVKG